MIIFSTWFTTYFLTLNINVNVSSLFLTLYLVAVLIGMIIKKYLIKFINEKKILLYGTISSFIFLLLAFIIDNLFLKNVLIFVYGISIAGNFAITFSLATYSDDKHYNVSSGFLHAAAYLGVIIFQFISGFLSEHFSKNSMIYIALVLLFILFIIFLIINKNINYSSNDYK